MTSFTGKQLRKIAMNDLIIKLNLKESTSQYCIIETYTGELKTMKKRTFSGPLKPVNMLVLDSSENFSPSILEKSKALLREGSRQIQKNKYLLVLPSLIKFLSSLNNTRGVYCTSSSRGLYELDGIDVAELKLFDSKTDKKCGLVYLELRNGEKVNLNSNCSFRTTCEKTLIFANHRLYVVEQNINIVALKKLLDADRCNFREIDFKQVYNCVCEFKKTTNEITDIRPIPVIYVAFADSTISGKLFFSYNGNEIPSNSSEKTICDTFSKLTCFRSLMDENRALQNLASAGWKQSTDNGFYLAQSDKMESSITELINNEFEVLTYDNKRIQSSTSASYQISYGVDWFDLHVASKGNAKPYDLTHLIDIKMRKRYIELDDKIILLPDTIWENRKVFEQVDGKISIAKRNIGQISEILSDPKISSTFDVDKIVQYENIELHLPTALNNILRKYQKDGIQWLMYLYRNRFGGCLADDMGLGKTIQIIAFLSSWYLIESRMLRTLVVVPKTLIGNWENEFRKYGKGLAVNTYHGAKKEAAFIEFEKNGGVLITTYNTLLKDIDLISKDAFDCMVVDEAQYLKNYRSKAYMAAKKIDAQSKFILSGTPFENNIIELWALMDLINPGCLGHRTAFLKKYGDIATDAEIAKRLNARIKPFVLRRMKKDVLDELPEKTEVNLVCDMSDKQRELYESIQLSIKKEIARIPGRFEIKDASIVLEGLLYLRQVCCHPAILKKSLNWNHCDDSGKFDLFKLKVSELLENREKVVVFSQFTSVLDIMKKWAEQQQYKTYYLDGLTKNRQELVNRFEKSEEGIFFISLKAGGVGLNIVTCQYSIIYDPWWNPAVESQAADRIYRIGQKKNVFIYRMITLNSIEEKMELLKNEKKGIAENLLMNTDMTNKFSFEELKKLILG